MIYCAYCNPYITRSRSRPLHTGIATIIGGVVKLYRADYKLKSDLQSLNELQAWFRQLCERYGQGRRLRSQRFDDRLQRLNIALAEGFSNAVRHAHADLPQDTTIEVKVALGPQQIEIQIWDLGRPFDPDSVVEPKPGTLRQGGYGWFLLRRLVDQVSYDRQDNRNCLRIKQSWA